MLRYWDVFREMEELRRALDRTFGEVTWRWPFSRISFLPGISARQYPLINIYDDKDNLYVEALAPGVDPKTLDVTVQQNIVTISGEKPASDEEVKPEAYHRSERAAGKFIRSFELDVPVQEDKVKAVYKNGILLLTLPKAESAKPKRIAITAG